MPQIAFSEEATDLSRDTLSYRQVFNFPNAGTKSNLHQFSFVSSPTPSFRCTEKTFLNLPSLISFRTSFFVSSFNFSSDFILSLYKGAEASLILSKIFPSIVPSPQDKFKSIHDLIMTMKSHLLPYSLTYQPSWVYCHS